LAKILVLLKRTPYTEFVLEDNDTHVKRLLARGDPTVRRLRRSHVDHEQTVRELRLALSRLGETAVYSDAPTTKINERFDLVITVGGDGTLIAASHQLGSHTPLLGINSAPEHSVGFFCAGHKGAVFSVLKRALASELPVVTISRMQVELNGKLLHGRVLNEALFCHSSPAATSKYILAVVNPKGRRYEEEQKSSGIWIGPAAGSTAAQRSAGGRVLPLSSSQLQYVVREPYTPWGHRLRHVQGLVEDGGFVELRNKMRTARLYLDGHKTEFKLALGDVLTMSRSSESLSVLGLARNGNKKKKK
jgi:NAD+ kinase